MTSGIRWSEQELKDFQSRLPAVDHQPQKVVREKKYRSKWESQYAQVLAFRQQAGDIKSWGYELITLVLPGGVRYVPDFLVEPMDGPIQFHEMKGRVRDTGRIKLRQAIEVFSYFQFFIVGKEMTPMALYRPEDVPATTRSSK